MRKIKAALIGLVVIAASIIAAPQAGAQEGQPGFCSPGAFMGSLDMLWKDGYQIGVHGAEDAWCNGDGTDYGSLHYNFDICPKNGNPCFSNWDTWMDYKYSWVNAFNDHEIQISGHSIYDVVVDGYTERNYYYTQQLLGNVSWAGGSIQMGCMPHGRCYGWDWAATTGKETPSSPTKWFVQILF